MKAGEKKTCHFGLAITSFDIRLDPGNNPQRRTDLSVTTTATE
ncbi:23703_t:CDS:2 [Dentiscutata erythropus]|uniref:23703_t:CDS:1 n=1 Tax=Dentiscutata erythropus TaxID=1348616 RepID=A0A9N8VXJ2_9GLOM|nr:23703_t:CDS:2 [Dentiscutata erythropus]